MTENKLLDHPNILPILFHPRHDSTPPPPGAHHVQVEVSPSAILAGRLYPSDPTAPLILFFHGNGEVAPDYDQIAGLYHRIGISLLVMDYRGYGQSTGTPTSSNLVSDAGVVFAKLPALCTEHELAPAQTYVMGRSLGSVPAIEIARESGERLAGLLIESGFSDTLGLLGRLGGVQVQGATEEQHGFGNAIKMQDVTTRTLILHGQRDVLIPPSDGQALYDNCAATDKHLELIPGAGHNDIMLVGLQRYFAAIASFVQGQSPAA